MQIITKNNRKYYRFKIGDEFSTISGKGSFNKMKKEGLCSDDYNEEQGFIYPCLDASSSNNHIKGYSKKYNYEGDSIKVVKDGVGAGKTRYFNNKIFVTGGAYLLNSFNFSNSYVALFLEFYFHEKLAIVIKRILEYKQLPKQLSKQIKDYKLAILQQSEKAIKHWKETGQKDKYITFKIGDEFKGKLIDARHYGRASEKELKLNNNFSKQKNSEFRYPIYDASISNNISKGTLIFIMMKG